MPIYKHYSFDLWLTLIKSNPDFKMQRAILFQKQYNYTNKTIEEVVAIFRQVDIMCNTINEKTGKNIDTDEMYLMVLLELNNYNPNLPNINLPALYNQVELILFNYLPTIYCANTFNTLQQLQQITNSPFNLLSNTAFIKGSSLQIVLNHLNLSQFFSFQVYSNEEGISKPNAKIFELMFSKAKVLQPQNNLLPNECIHIGDNFNADILGAQQIGLQSLQINTNTNTILNLLP